MSQGVGVETTLGLGHCESISLIVGDYKSPMFLKDQIRSYRPNVCNLTVEDDLDSACSVAQDPETPKKPVKKTTKKLTTEECLIKAAEQIVEKPRTYNFTKRVKTE